MSFLRDPVLAGVEHGFGTGAAADPDALVRPVQVHGAAVAWAAAGSATPAEADAIATGEPGLAVGVVTADCVPVLLVAGSGAAVAAVHAGWRGLAAGVVRAGVDALHARADGAELRAAIGPHIGACCYEVDAPVLDALRARFGARVDAAARAARPGHAMLALGALVAQELAAAGLAPARIGRASAACTGCDPRRFPSYRREGSGAGRMVHWVRAAGAGRA